MKNMLHGGDYNPEQWLDYPEVLKEDIRMMKKAHCNTMTLGIFSWAFLEPEEGVYNFSYLDKIIDDLRKNGINIILATPSGARPRWLSEKYPEVLRVMKNGQRMYYQRRHNHCYTSPVYREKVKNINTLLAERYKDKIIMWHISNELGGECHCELCQKAFRDYLRKKYDNDLNKLNHAWWSGFWSHTVTDFNQVHSPFDLGEGDGVMPGLFLDWKEFVTYQTTEFMKEEIASVKAVTPDIPVTSNFMGPYQRLNYHYMKDFVDVISWDSYPSWHSDRGNDLEAYSIAFAHDLHRCLKMKPFYLMESTPSNTNWLPVNKLKRPNMHKLSSLQAVAHGSDSVLYFQWRKGRGGEEKFHGAVVDHNGKDDTRVFRDVTDVGVALEKLTDVVGTKTHSEVAVVYEFKNRWAIDVANGMSNIDKKYKRTCINHYKEFWKRGVNVDVIGLNQDLSKYKILVLPMLYLMTEEEIKKVEEYVANGGTVVGTYATAYVNGSDLCYLGGFPGNELKDVFGLTADEIDALYDTDRNSVLMSEKSYEVVDLCELITPTTAKTLGVYGSDFYKGTPAVLKNSYKKGKAYYIGCRDTGELLNDFYDSLIKEHNIKAYDLPKGVTLHTREEFIFVENYLENPVEVSLDGEFKDVETGEVYKDKISLEGFGIKVLR